MKRKALLTAAFFMMAIAAPSLAKATTFYTSGGLGLRAGPSSDYPVVATIPTSAHVGVYGCVEGYGWCDVEWNGVRGWTTSRQLRYSHHHHWIGLSNGYQAVNVPVIVFEQQNYWDRYYRDRPFYRAGWHHDNGRGHAYGRDDHGNGRPPAPGPDRFDHGDRGHDRGYDDHGYDDRSDWGH